MSPDVVRRPRRAGDAVPALLAALTFGASIPANQRLFDGVGKWFAGGWLYLTAGVGLAIGLALVPRLRTLAPGRDVDDAARRRGRWGLLAATLCGAVVAPFAELRGLAELPAGVASLLLNVEGVLTPLVAVVFFGERLSPSRWAGAGLVVVGGIACALATSGAAESGASAAGVLWIVLACAAWAADSNLMRLLVHRAPLEVARDKGLLGGTASLLIAFAVGGAWPLAGESGGATASAAIVLAGGAGVGVVAYGISVALYLVSLRRLETAVTGALFATAPFVGAIVSWIALGERPGGTVVAAAVAMGAGVWLLARPARPGRRDASPGENAAGSSGGP